MRIASFGKGVGRGVWLAPWMGPNGELILVAVRRDDRMVGERMLSLGDNHVQASDELWAALEAADPQPQLKVI
jgi:hypothetical protein